MANILLIQRERIFLTMYGRALVLAGHEVTGCDGFHSGEHLLRELQPKVVICGFHRQMHHEDLEEIEALREIDSDVPIIVISCRTETTPVLEAMHAGASLVVKQLGSRQLTDLIDRVCSDAPCGRYVPNHEQSKDGRTSRWAPLAVVPEFTQRPTIRN